ncbi:MAG: nucleotidyltransferase family protein [Sphaerochaeta sp.]|nr:nucleotidyltransferase family protein [Sphaerochaeta sp.]MDD4300916.1 nucleotidyltransferase family protein [Sphaerochaeta sp.]MDD4646643.1 nucleotidyltransferase family protein [Sphaerochaeta sp.]MDY0243210.1 nucleotidyltransferase family protein [Sphaerochaeta sp.]
MQNLILAAGLGMRSKGKKLLLPYKGTTIVAHAVQQSLMAGLRTVLVTGFKADQVKQAVAYLACPQLQIVHNEHYRKGQGSSTICGASYLGHDSPFFISLADMPLIESRHYLYLIEQTSAPVSRPSYKGKLGHPVLLDPSFLAIIRSQKSSFTMRGLLQEYHVQTIEVDDEAYVTDIDTLDAYHHLVDSSQSYGQTPLPPLE